MRRHGTHTGANDQRSIHRVEKQSDSGDVTLNPQEAIAEVLNSETLCFWMVLIRSALSASNHQNQCTKG